MTGLKPGERMNRFAVVPSANIGDFEKAELSVGSIDNQKLHDI